LNKEFKVGDKVVIVKSRWDTQPVGTVSTVLEVYNGGLTVSDVMEKSYGWNYPTKELDCLRHLTKLEQALK